MAAVEAVVTAKILAEEAIPVEEIPVAVVAGIIVAVEEITVAVVATTEITTAISRRGIDPVTVNQIIYNIIPLIQLFDIRVFYFFALVISTQEKSVFEIGNSIDFSPNTHRERNDKK